MNAIFAAVLKRIVPLIKLPERTIKKVISIEERIRQIRDYVVAKVEATFAELVGRGDKVEAIVSFLALLELVKQRTVVMDQKKLFGDIYVKRI